MLAGLSIRIVAHDAAVSVVGVRAQAQVAGDVQLREGFSEQLDGADDRRGLRVCTRGGAIFVRRLLHTSTGRPSQNHS